jgi:hypothetical protein
MITDNLQIFLISFDLLYKNSELVLFFKAKQVGSSNNVSDWYSGNAHFVSCLRHKLSEEVPRVVSSGECKHST